MATASRYRLEHGRSCIDIRLRSPRQLFDLRDPAPFRERDLDPAAADHIMTSVREIGMGAKVLINLHIARNNDEHIPPAVLTEAIRGHFLHERDLVERAIARNFRHGRHLFVIGVAVLALFLTLSRVSDGLLSHLGIAHEILKEGLVITGWVAMWRPAEVLLYDWFPLYEQRRWIDKLLESEIEVDQLEMSVAPDATPLSRL